MAPTEQTILNTFLLTPSSLPTILSLQSFTALFPRAEQTSPEIKRLYRSLQHKRALLTDSVAQEIDVEVQRGNAQRRAVVRSRRAAGKEEADEEVVVENALFGSTSNLPVSNLHTMSSALRELVTSELEVFNSVNDLDEEADKLLVEIKSIAGGLSDLRYGRLANGELKEDVLRGLLGLNSACERS